MGDADVACGGEQLVEQGSPLLIDTGVVASPDRSRPDAIISMMSVCSKHFQRAQKNSPCNIGLSADAGRTGPITVVGAIAGMPAHRPRGIATADARLSSQPNKSIAVPYITESSNSFG